MPRIVAIAIAAILITPVLTGCENGQDSSADEQAIRQLVAELNRAGREGDARLACKVIAPASIRNTFGSRARCIRETEQILKSAGRQPRLVVESIRIDGDAATVSFEGRNGDADVIREDGSWYLPIGAGERAADGDSNTATQPEGQ